MAKKEVKVDLSAKAAISELAKLKGAYDKQNKSSGEASRITREYTSALKTLSSQTGSLQLKLNKVTGTIGLSLGFKELIGSAHDANMEIWQLHNSVKDLTDSYGDTGKVMGSVWKAYGSSAVSLNETIQIMRGLNQSGLEVNETISDMAGWIGRVYQASGVSTEALTGLMGKSIRFWKVTQRGAEEMVHSVFAAKAAFKLTSKQTEELLGIVNITQDRIAYAFKDGEKSSIALAKGISMAAGAMEKLGVNSQTATSFVEGLLDPEKISQNTALLRRMGITYMDQVSMMESAQGKEVFFDKLMMQLPKISTELASIRDPFVRMNVAKNLGLPMEIASKMAGKTSGEIQNMLAEYKDMKKAADVQQKKMKAQQERFDEAKKWLKWNALMPLMEWAQKMYKYMWPFLNAVSNGMQKANKYFVTFLDATFDAFRPIYDLITGTSKGDVIKTISEVALNAFSGLVNFFATNMPTLIQTAMPFLVNGIVTGISTFMDAIPIIIEGVGKLIYTGFEKGLGTGSLILGFLTGKLLMNMKDMLLQYAMIQGNWTYTNALLSKIALHQGVEDIGKKSGIFSKLFGMFGKGAATATTATATTGTVTGTAAKVATGTMSEVGAVASRGAGMFSKFTGTFGKFVGLLKIGATFGKVVPILGAIIGAIQIIPGIFKAISAFWDKSNTKNNFEFNEAEEAKLQAMRDGTIAQDKELLKRQSDASEYKMLMAKKEKGYTDKTEEARDQARLQYLEDQKESYQSTRAYGGYMFGMFDAMMNVIPGVDSNLRKTFEDWMDGTEAIKRATQENKNAAQSMNDSFKPGGQNKGNTAFSKEYYDQLNKINSLEKQYAKDKDYSIKKQMDSEKQRLLEIARTQNDVVKKSGSLSAESFYNQAKNIEMLDGKLGTAADRMKYFAEEANKIRAGWDTKAFDEKENEARKEEYKDSEKYAKFLDFRQRNAENMLEQGKKWNDKSLQEQAQKQIEAVKAEREKSMQTGGGRVVGKSEETRIQTDRMVSALVGINVKNSAASLAKYDEMIKQSTNMSEFEKAEAAKSLNISKKNLELAKQGNYTQEDLLNVQIQSYQTQKAKLEAEYKDKYGGFWGTVKSAFTDNDNQMESAMKTLDAKINALIKEKDATDDKRTKETNKYLSGIGMNTAKTAKNTEKEPAKSQDYIGNLMRYMGGNVDLRTVGF